jgi:hypothetical protein
VWGGRRIYGKDGGVGSGVRKEKDVRVCKGRRVWGSRGCWIQKENNVGIGAQISNRQINISKRSAPEHAP